MLTKRLAFWLAVLVFGVCWAWILDRFISIGPFTPQSYNIGKYDENKLCGLVKPGMEVSQVNSLISSLGKPNEIEYQRAEEQDIEFVRRTLQSGGRSNEHMIPSDLAGDLNEPNTTVYLNNVLRVGGNHGLCDIQMDSSGRKVVKLRRSGSGGIE